MSYTLKFFIGCSIYVCSCSTLSFSSPSFSSPANSTPRFLMVRHFPLLQIPVTQQSYIIQYLPMKNKHSKEPPCMKRNQTAKTFCFQVSDINAYDGRRQVRCFRLHLWTSCLQWIHLHLQLSQMLLPHLVFFSRLHAHTHTHTDVVNTALLKPQIFCARVWQNYTTLKITINLILTILFYFIRVPDNTALLLGYFNTNHNLNPDINPLTQFPAGLMPLQLLHWD